MSSIAQEQTVTTGVRGPLAELGIRSESGRKRKTMSGPFVPFDEWIEVDSIIEGHFMESFAPGSVDKSIRERRDKMRAILHHGREGLGTMPIGKITDLHADAKAGYYEVELFDGLPTVLLEGIEAGQYGTSMRFELMRMGNTRVRLLSPEQNPQNLLEHRVLEAKVIELGPTPFNAYEGAAVLGLRSLTDDVMLERLAEEPEKLRKLAERSGISLAGVVVPTGPALSDTDELPQIARRYERACEFVESSFWLLTPAVLATIVRIFVERTQGHRPTPEEISERIGARERSEADQPAADSPVRVIGISGVLVPHAGMMADVSTPGRSVDEIRAELNDAMASEDVKAILFNVDSPGGSAELIPELAATIRDARATKPIWAVANTMAGSGGYYLAAQASKLYVTPSGDVGSLGVRTIHEDLSAKLEQDGITMTTISAGKYKSEGSPFEPLSDEAKAYAQERIDAIYKRFVADVAEGRGVTTKKVESDFGQGRMVMAEKAVERGMADGVATFEQALANLEKKAAKSISTRAAAPDERAPERSDATTLERSRRSTQPTTKDYLSKEEPRWKLK